MKIVEIKKIVAIVLAVVAMFSLNVLFPMAASTKTYLPTSIVAYNYVNGRYIKGGTEILQYNKNKRVKKIKTFDGETKKITYTMRKNKIRGIKGDIKVTINADEYVTGLTILQDGYNTISVERGDDDMISHISMLEGEYPFDYSISYEYDDDDVLCRTIMTGVIDNYTDYADSVRYDVKYNKQGFIKSYRFKSRLTEIRSKYVYSRDSKGRLTRIVVKDMDEDGNYVIVGKYVLKYKNSPTTTNKGTLRSIVNSLLISGDRPVSVVVVNAFRRDKPLSVNHSYDFVKRYYYKKEAFDGA